MGGRTRDEFRVNENSMIRNDTRLTKFWEQDNIYQAEEIWDPGKKTNIRLMKIWETQFLVIKTNLLFINTGMSIKDASVDFKKRGTSSSFSHGGSLRPFESIFSYHMQIRSNNPDCTNISISELSLSVGPDPFTSVCMERTVLWSVTV